MLLKKASIAFLVFLIGISGNLTLAITPASQPNILIVCPSGCDYDSIQDAIYEANPGDIIKVKSGAYKANLTINKNLTLKGAGQEKVKVEGIKDGYPVLLIGPSETTVKVEGITVTKAKGMRCADPYRGVCSNGISVTGKANLLIQNSTISENRGYGIELFHSSRANILNNVIKDNGWGIASKSDKEVTGTGNKMTGNEVDLGGNLSGTLRKPLAKATQQRIVFPCEHYPTLQHAIDGLLPGGTIILMRGTYKAGITISKKLSLKAKKGAKVTLVGRGKAVLSLVKGADLNLERIKVSRGSIGIAGGGGEATIRGSLISKNAGDGIMLRGFSRITITNSTISDNEWSGIALLESAHATVTNATISDNSYGGVELYNTGQAEVTNSTIMENGNGIEIIDSSQLGIKNNKIVNNRGYGVTLHINRCISNLILPTGLRFKGTIKAENNRIEDNRKGPICPEELEKYF